MNANFYDAVINHANINYSKAGKQLFDRIDNLSFKIYELSELNNIQKHMYIDRLNHQINDAIELYANKHHIKID